MWVKNCWNKLVVFQPCWRNVSHICSQEILSLLTPIWVGAIFTPPPFCFPLITQKRLKLYLWHFAAFSNVLLETLVPNLVSLTRANLQISEKLRWRFLDIWSVPYKKNCHNMKLGAVTKLDKKNMATSKKFDHGFKSTNFDVIAIFSIYGLFGATWNPNSGRMVCNTYIFINSNL